MSTPTFRELNLAPPIQQALEGKGYTTPSPIQAQSIPHLLKGKDLLGCAQTGTGKTAAFSLPILDFLHHNPRQVSKKSARCLVLTPTRELASQIAESFKTYGKGVRFSQALVFGGVNKNPQNRALSPGVDVLVACPGRLLDHLQEGTVRLDEVDFFVLDEVDRMLDMGFLRDVKKIIAELPQEKQSLFFSATLAGPIRQLAQSILRNPVEVSIAPKVTTAEKVDQKLCLIQKDDKRELLIETLREQPAGELTIVFSRTKHGADKLARWIRQAGIDAEAIHGNRSQPQRERALAAFRSGKSPVLVATDVAARGVDVKDVTLVVNYDLPNEAEAYVHRIGRTGRAGAIGRAVSFATPEEHEFLIDIEKLIKKSIPLDEDCYGFDGEFAALHASGRKSPLSSRSNNGKGRQGGGVRQPRGQENRSGSSTGNGKRRRSGGRVQRSGDGSRRGQEESGTERRQGRQPGQGRVPRGDQGTGSSSGHAPGVQLPGENLSGGGSQNSKQGDQDGSGISRSSTRNRSKFGRRRR